MKHLLAILFALLCSSCLATSHDLERVHQRIEQAEVATAEQLQLLVEHQAPLQEVVDAIEKEWGSTSADVAQVARDVKQRGSDLTEQLLVSLGTVLLGGVGLNVHRNRTRQAVIRRHVQNST